MWRFSKTMVPPEVPQPWWCAGMVAHRGLFTGIAVGRRELESEVFLCMFAKRLPLCSTFLVLRRGEFAWPAADDDHGRAALVGHPWHRLDWAWMPTEFKNEGELPFERRTNYSSLMASAFWVPLWFQHTGRCRMNSSWLSIPARRDEPLFRHDPDCHEGMRMPNGSCRPNSLGCPRLTLGWHCGPV